MTRSKNADCSQADPTGECHSLKAGGLPPRSRGIAPGGTTNEVAAAPDAGPGNPCRVGEKSEIPEAEPKNLMNETSGDQEGLRDSSRDLVPDPDPNEVLVCASDSPSDSKSNPAEDSQEDMKSPEADRRSERIAEYMCQEMESVDPLIANVGAINGDLMHIAHGLKRALDQSLGELAHRPEALGDMLLPLNLYLRVSKQVDRMTQLAIKLKIMNQSTADIGELLQERARRSEKLTF
jgi:hypothetical protein